MTLRIAAATVATLSALVGLEGCGPPDVAGTYDVNLVAVTEDCPDVDEGDQISNVTLVVDQNGRSVSATASVPWFVITLMYDFLGETHHGGFSADSTDSVDVPIAGTNCVMTYTFNIDATVDATSIGGEMTQFGTSNGDASCTVDMCTATWNMAGVRNP
jgi:hypothetical protein